MSQVSFPSYNKSMYEIKHYYEGALNDCKVLKELMDRLQQLERAVEGVNHSFYSYRTVAVWSDFLDFIRSPLVINNGITFRDVMSSGYEPEGEMIFQCNLSLDELVSILKQVYTAGNEDVQWILETLNYAADFTGQSFDGRVDDGGV
jgi:hypothetical protein